MGETGDDRPLYHPFANLVQRFLSDVKFHRQMTAARVKKGEKPYTIEDLRGACAIHDHSVRTGQAGRKK
eukprot:1318532-Pyramimonas_sp.AAC.1